MGRYEITYSCGHSVVYLFDDNDTLEWSDDRMCPACEEAMIEAQMTDLEILDNLSNKC